MSRVLGTAAALLVGLALRDLPTPERPRETPEGERRKRESEQIAAQIREERLRRKRENFEKRKPKT